MRNHMKIISVLLSLVMLLTALPLTVSVSAAQTKVHDGGDIAEIEFVAVRDVPYGTENPEVALQANITFDDGETFVFDFGRSPEEYLTEEIDFQTYSDLSVDFYMGYDITFTTDSGTEVSGESVLTIRLDEDADFVYNDTVIVNVANGSATSDEALPLLSTGETRSIYVAAYTSNYYRFVPDHTMCVEIEMAATDGSVDEFSCSLYDSSWSWHSELGESREDGVRLSRRYIVKTGRTYYIGAWSEEGASFDLTLTEVEADPLELGEMLDPEEDSFYTFTPDRDMIVCFHGGYYSRAVACLFFDDSDDNTYGYYYTFYAQVEAGKTYLLSVDCSDYETNTFALDEVPISDMTVGQSESFTLSNEESDDPLWRAYGVRYTPENDEWVQFAVKGDNSASIEMYNDQLSWIAGNMARNDFGNSKLVHRVMAGKTYYLILDSNVYPLRAENYTVSLESAQIETLTKGPNAFTCDSSEIVKVFEYVPDASGYYTIDTADNEDVTFHIYDPEDVDDVYRQTVYDGNSIIQDYHTPERPAYIVAAFGKDKGNVSFDVNVGEADYPEMKFDETQSFTLDWDDPTSIYRFTAEETAPVNLNVTADTGYLNLSVYEGAETLRRSDVYLKGENGSYSYSYTFIAEQGQEYILRFSIGETDANVAATLEKYEPEEIRFGETKDAELIGCNPVFYRFTPTEDVRISSLLDTGYGGVYMQLLDGGFNSLTDNIYNELRYRCTGGETYYLFIGSFDSPYYDESAQITLSERTTPAYPQITLGETVTLDIEDGSEYTYLKYTPDEDMTIRFYSTCDSSIDPVGGIFRYDMELDDFICCIENDDGSEDYNFKATYRVKAGETYYLGARLWRGSGSFDVTLDRSPVWDYRIYDESDVTINGYYGEESEVVIPSEIDGYPVTGIGYNAFRGNDALVSVEMPDTVTYISDNVFDGCYHLKEIKLSEALTSIGYEAFRDCSSLEQIIIPDSVNSISGGAFLGCSSMHSVSIPAFTDVSEHYAFGYLTAEYDDDTDEYVTTKMDDFIITGYTGSSAAEYAQTYGFTFISLGAMPDEPASHFGYAIREDGTAKITAYFGNQKNVKIPAFIDGHKVTDLGRNLFSSGNGKVGYLLYHIENVTLPDTLERIEMWAFENCVNLKTIHIPKNTFVEERAFLGCTGLQSITADSENPYYLSADGVLYSKDRTILYVYPIGKGLTEYTVPEGVKEIGTAAFYNNAYRKMRYKNVEGTGIALERIILPDSLERIGNWAFYASGLDSITIPKNVSLIACNAFMNYEYDEEHMGSVKAIEVDPANAYFCSVDGVLYTKDMKTLCFVPDIKERTTFTIPDAVEFIGENAFCNHIALTSIEIPAGVKEIMDDAFSGCYYLSEVTLNEGLMKVGDRAFLGCASIWSDAQQGMKKIEIPQSVISIGEKAFGWYAGMPYGNPVKSSYFTVYGYMDTAAQTYAEANELPFVALGDGPEPIIGDADGDGELTSVDVTVIQRYLAGMRVSADENALLRGDVDGNGEVDIIDATFIQRHLAGMEIPYVIG